MLNDYLENSRPIAMGDVQTWGTTMETFSTCDLFLQWYDGMTSRNRMKIDQWTCSGQEIKIGWSPSISHNFETGFDVSCGDSFKCNYSL